MLFFILLITVYQSHGQSDTNHNVEQSILVDTADENLVWGACPSFMPDGCAIAVLHGDPAKNNLDILFKVPANSIIPNHWHHSAERMILLSGELEITYEGEKTQIMKKGNYAYGPSKKPHSAKCGKKEPCIIFIAFVTPLDAFPLVPKTD
ncbi:MAG: cupin [Flavobacteriaceae bacterium]|nr:MAG: cupin [Flavobacteriaceae bacterium]